MTFHDAREIVDEYVAQYRPLDLARREAWYKYSTTGDKLHSAREDELILAIRKLNSDKSRYEKLKSLYANLSSIGDEALKREVEILFFAHLPNQVASDKIKRLTELESRLRQGFNDYNAKVDGKALSPVDLSHALSDSTDSTYLEKVWKAQHQIAPILENDYREMVKLKNSIARDLGFKNALELSAKQSEMSIELLDKFYGEVDRASSEPFRRLKEKYIDPRLAKRYGIEVSELMPWHYQNAFFQEAPTAIFGQVDLDEFYSGMDSNAAIKKVEEFYSSIGVDVGDIIKNSSLFPKPGKYAHACAEMLDPGKPGSAILIMNLPDPPKPPKASDVSTLIHELAHDINFDAVIRNKEIPYLLKDPSMLTEAVAMLFEKQGKTLDWFMRIGVPENKAAEAVDAVELIDYVDQLIFLRWAMAIYEFEKGFFADPDRDIGDLWWKCRESCQFLKRPKGWTNPDALAKYHIPNVEPLYYANYAIGRVANVQFAELLAKRVGQDMRVASYYGKKELGSWLMKDFLAQGRLYRWDDFITKTTGQPFSVDSWERRYIGSGIEKKLGIT